mmetsp:Transcript_23673/g.51750  ORF Transcript_23673/g.51750 Transcript_23673/m.51750 type:complete len:122 (+) Transcript_23673:1177-1542(+)
MTNSSLNEIYLDRCGIGSEGCEALATALKSNRTLSKIHLDGNNVQEEGAFALVDMLESNTTILVLETDEDFCSHARLAISKRLRLNALLHRVIIPMVLASRVHLSGEEVQLEMKELIVGYL